MKNIYDGTVRLDADGRAQVVLPAWFEALNEDFRYQLTSVDGPAPALHVAARLRDGRFSIGGTVALAAWLSHESELPAGPVVAILSGGNVDGERYAELIAEGLAAGG